MLLRQSWIDGGYDKGGKKKKDEGIGGGILQAVKEKKEFVVQFEEGQKRGISYSFLSYVCEKQEAVKEVEKTLSDLLKIVQGGFLKIDGDTVYEGYGVFGK